MLYVIYTSTQKKITNWMYSFNKQGYLTFYSKMNKTIDSILIILNSLDSDRKWELNIK